MPDPSLNVLGGALQPCSTKPMTGFYRNGCCDTGPEDRGQHTVCAVMTAEFLALSKYLGNDLSTSRPEYGFVGLKYQSAFEYDRIEVPASVSVEVLARCASMTQEEFLNYNPGVLRFALPPDPEIQAVQIKKGEKKAFEVAFAKIPPQERISFARHTVKRGETLSTIAAKYGVTTDDIALMNRISCKT